MADPRILQFPVTVETGTTNFNIQFCVDPEPDDSDDWTYFKKAGTHDIASGGVSNGYYSLDGINTTDDANNNGAAASSPPAFYRTRVKTSGLWGSWSDPFCYPSPQDFIRQAMRRLKDPTLDNKRPLLSRADYALNLATAIEIYEIGRPAILESTVALADSVLRYPLPSNWAYGDSIVVGADYPFGTLYQAQINPEYVYVDETNSQFVMNGFWPATGNSMRVLFTGKHKRDGSSIGVGDFQSVMLWMAGESALMIGSHKNQFGDLQVGAEYVGIDPRISSWFRLGNELKKQAERMWGGNALSVRTNIDDSDTHSQVPPRVAGNW